MICAPGGRTDGAQECIVTFSNFQWAFGVHVKIWIQQIVGPLVNSNVAITVEMPEKLPSWDDVKSPAQPQALSQGVLKPCEALTPGKVLLPKFLKLFRSQHNRTARNLPRC